MQNRSVLILIGAIVALGIGGVALAKRSFQSAPSAHPPQSHQAAEEAATAIAPRAGVTDASAVRPPAASAPSEISVEVIPKPTGTLQNPTLRTFIDKASAPRFGGDFEARVPTISHPDEIAWVVYVLRDHTDLDAVRNEAANLLRRSGIAEVDQHLRVVLASPFEKERFQSFAAQHLGDMMRELRNGTTPEQVARARLIHDDLTHALSNPHFMVRSEALMALARERDPRAAAIIRKGINDPQWSQGQDLLIRCAKEAELTDLIPSIRPLAYSPNDVVRIAAVNVLAQWRDEVSRTAFEEASRSAVPRLQRAGTLALMLLDKPQ